MDMTAYAESEYLTVKMVKELGSRQGVIIRDAIIEEGEYGMQPKFLVELAGKQKEWKPNKGHLSLLINAFGKDSSQWIGKPIVFFVADEKVKISPIIDHVASIMQHPNPHAQPVTVVR